MFYAVEILSHKKPLGVPWICGVYDARSKLPVGLTSMMLYGRAVHLRVLVVSTNTRRVKRPFVCVRVP